MPRGEKKAGGRPKGSPNKKTIEKQQQLAALKELVMAETAPLALAQIAHAKGIKYLMARNKKGGQFKRVTEEMAHAYAEGTLSQEDDIIEVWEKDPSVPAFDSLMNRTYGKPEEPDQNHNIKMPAMEAILARLVEGRKRAQRR